MSIEKTRFFAYVALFFAPAFAATNIIFGRALLSVEPFTLALIRWSIAALILVIICRHQLHAMRTVYRENKLFVFTAGFLTCWMCGGVVYYALHYTTATNGTLIYTTPPIMILIMEAIWRGRAIKAREIIGVVLAFCGIFVLVIQGDAGNLATLSFNKGDLILIAAATSWAIYSVMLKSKPFARLDALPILSLVSLFGALTLIPVAAYEVFGIGKFPTSVNEWIMIAGVVLVPTLLAFSSFQFGVKVLGSSIGGMFLYLMPPWGLFQAWILLGETLEPFHIVGMAFVMTGIICATLPMRFVRERLFSR